MALEDYGTRMPALTFSSFSFPRGLSLFRRKVSREVKIKQELQNPSTLKTISVYTVYGVCECAQATRSCGGQVTACVSASALHLALSLEVLAGLCTSRECPPISNLLLERWGLRTCAAGSGFYVDSGYLNSSLLGSSSLPPESSPRQPQAHF